MGNPTPSFDGYADSDRRGARGAKSCAAHQPRLEKCDYEELKNRLEMHRPYSCSPFQIGNGTPTINGATVRWDVALSFALNERDCWSRVATQADAPCQL